MVETWEGRGWSLGCRGGGGLVLGGEDGDVGTAPDVSHACEDGEGETRCSEVACASRDGFSEGGDGEDEGFEESLVGVADEDGAEVVVKDNEDEGEVFAAELAQLDFIICAGDGLSEAGEDTLEEGGEEGVKDAVNVFFKAEDDLVKEAEKHGHLVLGGALR